jgi:hypothetical protein
VKNNMLVLLNRPEDIESHLSELIDIAKTHEIASISLVRVSPPFGSRTRSRVAPHKLNMATRMSDEAVTRYLFKIADTLHEEGVDCEPISSSISAMEINRFIEKHDFHLIVRVEGRSGLSRWSAEGLIGTRVVPMNNT